MKSAGKARNNGLYRHIRTSKEIIRNLLNDCNLTINYCKDTIKRKRDTRKASLSLLMITYNLSYSRHELR